MESILSILPELVTAIKETFYMLSIGLCISISFGGLLGIYLFVWNTKNLAPQPLPYFLVGGLVNIIRSFPFVILMIAVGPLTRILTNTTIGPIAASVPLSIAGIAYFSRLVELAFTEVPKETIEAAQSMGANNTTIITSVLLKEARSSLVLAVTALSISYLSYSAAAGIIGGGGIGDLAIRYGYYRFQTEIMVLTVAGLILFVQILQSLGNHFAKQLDKRK